MRHCCLVICISLALAGLAIPVPSEAQVICISNVSPPPELPVYEQPPIPGPGYMWTPGYWASGPYGYFWVPGTWVEPPTIGLLWTPGYWGWRDGIYLWNAGYWGPTSAFTAESTTASGMAASGTRVDVGKMACLLTIGQSTILAALRSPMFMKRPSSLSRAQ